MTASGVLEREMRKCKLRQCRKFCSNEFKMNGSKRRKNLLTFSANSASDIIINDIGLWNMQVGDLISLSMKNLKFENVPVKLHKEICWTV